MNNREPDALAWEAIRGQLRMKKFRKCYSWLAQYFSSVDAVMMFFMEAVYFYVTNIAEIFSSHVSLQQTVSHVAAMELGKNYQP